jgi:hypothetical protein
MARLPPGINVTIGLLFARAFAEPVLKIEASVARTANGL